MASQVPIPFLTTIDAKQSLQVANVVSMFAKTGFATVSNSLSLCHNENRYSHLLGSVSCGRWRTQMMDAMST
jgi:hypothetical protein